MIGSKKSLRETYPHVDERFSEVLLMALRMRNVSGPRIGEILAEVETHCAASGEPASEAFGDPKDYAESLDYEGQQRASVLIRGSDLVLGATQLLGAALTTWGLDGALRGHQVDVRLGSIAVAALTIVVLVVAVRHLESLLTRKVWLWFALNFGFIALMFGLLFWLRQVAFSAPGAVLAVLGVFLLVVPAVVATVRHRDASSDMILNPGEAPSAKDLRKSKALTVAAVWMLPVLIPAMSITTWLASR